MYQVYKLTFGDYVYIGCTNNIRRRKDQHNGNARNRKSKLGRFLNDRNIVLKIDDFEILATSDNRAETLKLEKEITIQNEQDGHKLLNDNYSSDCSRKGKNIGNTAKAFVVIDCHDHTAVTVTDLRQFCLNVGLDYKGLHRTSTRGHIYKNRYCAFHANDWEKEQDKDKYLSGQFMAEITNQAISHVIARTVKQYEVAFPDGHSEIVTNLDKFAREHNLTSGTLHATYIKRKPTKGYQVIRRI